jgi:hypothetical protein
MSGDAFQMSSFLCIGGVLIYFLVQTIVRLVHKQCAQRGLPSSGLGGAGRSLWGSRSG